MDLINAINAEHSKPQTLKIIKFVGKDKVRFKKLFDIFYNGEFTMAQRASWPVSEISILHPILILPYLNKLVEKLNSPDAHPAVARNVLRIFQEIDIPENLHGQLVDQCIIFITDIKKPIATRAFAITVAAKICSLYPELKNELSLILKELEKFPQPPALRVRIKSAFKNLILNK